MGIRDAYRALFKRVPAEKPFPNAKKNDVASFEHATFTLGPRYNPDDLIRAKGLSVYAKMRLDEQVKAVMVFKRDAITARGWSFKYDEGSKLEESERKRRTDVFTQILQKMHGSFLDALNLIATGRDYGFSMTEKVFTDVTVDGEQYVGLNLLLGRDPSTFEFTTDDYGILEKVEQAVPGKRITIDLRRFIHYVHSPEFDRFFGRSDLREAYRAWFIKQRVGDYWALYLERMAGGFMVANRGTESNMVFGDAEYTSLQELLRNLHSTSGIIPPPGVTIELVYPATTDAYEKAMVFWDLAIAKALLVPNLLGISHTGQTGAYSQSQTQLEAFFWTLNADSERLASCINEQLVRDLGDQNFGDGEYPYFCFKPASVEHIKLIIEQWKLLSDAKTVIVTEEDEAHFRKLLDMPQRDPGAKPLHDPVEEAMAQAIATGRVGADGKPLAPAKPDEPAAANDAKYAAIAQKVDDLVTLFAKREGAEGHEPHIRIVPHDKLDEKALARFTRATQRVAFSVIDRRQNRLGADLAAQLAGQVARTVKRLMGTDEELAKLIDEDPSDIANVELSQIERARLKDSFRRSLSGAWSLGQLTARAELERARGQRLVRMADLRDTAAEYFEANGFRMAGNVADAVRAMIQQELQNSIKFGRSPAQTREVIWQRLLDKGLTDRNYVRQVETDPDVIRALNELWLDTPEQAAHYLDTLARTNLFEAMNEARFAEFTDPALGGFVEAIEYSAILDDRTTDICRALDGKVFAADSDEWNDLRPPNHFNCRSVLVPVTAVDGWDGNESDRPAVDPAAGFGSGLQ